MNADIKLLRIFVTVVDNGGFAAAERELNLARSTISNHMAELEHRLGTTLCRRGRAGFALTAAGESVYREALNLLASAEAFDRHIDSLKHSSLSGELKLAITDGTLNDKNLKLHACLARFRELAPDVFLNLSNASQIDIETALAKKEIDLGIIAHHRSLPDFKYHHLYQEQHFLFCASNHAFYEIADKNITEAMLAEQAFVHADYQLNPEIQKLTHNFNGRASAGHMEARAQLILSGAFIGFLPEHFAAPLVAAGKIRTLKARSKSYRSDISAVHRKDAISDRLLTLFLAQLKEQHHVTATQN
ncbi:LysR family transcriptional regulator [uncultured Pseudoteredinibacter sp.]|uniref:LysR family transcriptional regulator n=1 Tax=uncultured Pseudoteredinibacter sp. TaxID=1641701 RepID=UPI00261239EB|nr:LysR family transcriptional regulator [uncultured Pseudoteredinibacter sp.]